jgi:hypothetical protein
LTLCLFSLLDIITARAEKGILDNGQGELIWLEQPAKGPLSGTWKAHTIAPGTDFFFELYDLDNDGVPEIMSPEYFGQQIQVFYTTSGQWNDSSSVQSIIVDKSLGNVRRPVKKTPTYTPRHGRNSDAKKSFFSFFSLFGIVVLCSIHRFEC